MTNGTSRRSTRPGPGTARSSRTTSSASASTPSGKLSGTSISRRSAASASVTRAVVLGAEGSGRARRR
ncbi:Uncharacterised protein [Mycobacteroides abscessus]|nr:Uncharacterised protein [Mycobacteroides abscessus]